MKKIALAIFALLLFVGTADAQSYREGDTEFPGQGASVVPTGGTDGAKWYTFRVDPVTKRLEVEQQQGQLHWGGGVVGDVLTAYEVSNNSAPWTVANWFPYKSVWISITGAAGGGATPSIEFFPQGSYNGIDWFYIISWNFSTSEGVAIPADTLKIVAGGTGAPFNSATGLLLDLTAMVESSGRFISSGPLLRAYGYLRLEVQNRTDDGSVTVSYKWGGSQ